MSEKTFSDAIEQVMLNNGFYASLSLIYKEFSKYREKTGKTPDKTIQERVQRDARFAKIGLGVYALTKYLDKLPKEISTKTEKDEIKKMHTHIQGMLIEIGNIEGYDTYTPDKNGIFINRELGKIATIDNIPKFTYEKIINDSIRFVDVIWFNERGFPSKLIEVENSTDFRAGFIKFNELQDFRTDFLFIAPSEKEQKFNIERTKVAFKNISQRCVFHDYDFVKDWYNHKLEGKKYK